VIHRIRIFFQQRIDSDVKAGSDQHGLQLAAAALLFEMLRADNEDHPAERLALEQGLQNCFSLSTEETRELMELADHAAAESVSLYQFTGLINESFTPEQKVQVVEMLWQVAYADGRLDPYEEALVRKVADLIYVPHRDFIQSKLRVLDQK